MKTKAKPVAKKPATRANTVWQELAKYQITRKDIQNLRALKYAGIPLRDPALIDLFGIRGTQSGVSVDETTAANFSAYFSGVTLLSNVIGMLPIECCKNEDGNVVPQPMHNGTRLFSLSPNPDMTPVCYKEVCQWNAVSWGNSYSRIDRLAPNGPVSQLWPMPPDQITPIYDKNTGKKQYQYIAKYKGEKNEMYSDDEILHIPGLMFDGLKGYSVARAAAESIGLGLAMEKFGASYFGNNAIPGGVITHPTELTNIAKNKLESEVEERVKGPYKTRRIVVLDEGMKYTPIGIPPEDSQFLQSRQFQVIEIARWLRIPPHMLFDFTGATFSNIENLGLEFLKYSLDPWLTRWAEELRKKLLTPREQESGYFFRFDVSAILRMDSKTRFEVYSSAKNMGAYTLNDILRKEGMPLVSADIGDIRLVPSTMKILGNSDPLAPIPPDVFQLATAALKDMASDGSKINPIKWDDAKQIINAMMPTASDAVVSSYLKVLVTRGIVSNTVTL